MPWFVRTASAIAGCAALLTSPATQAGPIDQLKPPQRPQSRAAAIQEDFFIQQLGMTTTRQGGAVVDVFMAVSFDPAATTSLRRSIHGTAVEIPDYRYLESIVAPLRHPSPAVPEGTYWEDIARLVVERLLAEPSVDGATVQLRVHPSCEIKAGDTRPRPRWRAAMASGGDAPLLPFIPTTEVFTCPGKTTKP